MNRQRHGFTIVELLVSISIIGLLMALLLPAVQSTRERARQIECRNHLHNLGLAMHSFETSHRHFPPRYHERELQAGRVSILTVTPNPHSVSPHYSMLPYLDQAELYTQITIDGDAWSGQQSSLNQDKIDIRIRVFLCPSDSGRIGSTNYQMNAGTSAQYYTTPQIPPPNSARIGIIARGDGLAPSHIPDGLSQTAAMSERLLGDDDPSVYTPSRDVAGVESSAMPELPDEYVALCQQVSPNSEHASTAGYGWLFLNHGGTVYNHILPPNSATPDCVLGTAVIGGQGAFTARSWHPGIVHLLLCDGSVKAISDEIDLTIWRNLGTSEGHETFSNP